MTSMMMKTLPLYSLTLPTFILLFVFFYRFAYRFVFRKWRRKHRPVASSCFASLAHGIPALLMAANAIINTQSSNIFASPNSALHNIILEYSLSYFLVDLFHYLIPFPDDDDDDVYDDILFILHHLATIYVLFTCRYMVHQGAHALLLLLILAESTSPCENLWTLVGLRRADVPAAAALHELLSPCFHALYSVFRGILGPVLFYYLMGFFLDALANHYIPESTLISWMIVIGTAMLVNMVLVVVHWVNWCKGKKKVVYITSGF
ncbi:hypothetical protein PTKIN_Ptkin17bG0098100 [Pterospermum kingtungense]